MIKIRKNVARKLFNEGTEIYLCPCNMRVDTAIKVKKTDSRNDFDKLVNEFAYYNCNSERGRYTSYYVD